MPYTSSTGSATTNLTGGLSAISNSNFAPLLSDGSSAVINETPALNAGENPALQNLQPRYNLSSQQSSDLQSISTLRNLNGGVVVPDGSGGFSLTGSGYNINFDPTTTIGRVSPLINPYTFSGAGDPTIGNISTFTGSNVILIIEIAEAAPDGKRYAKQLIEATTITVSIHREVVPVRASGYINPKGFALGTRTIAGTLILNQFTVEALLPFFQSSLVTDGSKDTNFTKLDQLPPFNITMLFTNEQGYASMRHLLGVKFVTDGVVYSIQDMLSEQTMSWMALDLTPLQPLTNVSMYSPVNPQNPVTSVQATPTSLMSNASLNSATLGTS